MGDFYVYVYLDPTIEGVWKFDDIEFTNEPFYIGKGKGRRIYSGISESRKDYYKNRRIKKMIKAGFFPIAKKLFENLTEENAFEIEKKLIKSIGRSDLKLGTLCNLTDGGEGTSNITTEWKKVLCKPVLQYENNLLTNEYSSVKEAADKTGLIKQNISACLTGKYKTTGGFSWQYKNKSDKIQGHLKKDFLMPKHTEETKLKMRDSAKRGDAHPSKKRMGKNNPSSRKVIQKSMEGETIKIWDSLQDISRELGYTPSNICRCCQGSVKRIGGFKWEYHNT